MQQQSAFLITEFIESWNEEQVYNKNVNSQSLPINNSSDAQLFLFITNL